LALAYVPRAVIKLISLFRISMCLLCGMNLVMRRRNPEVSPSDKQCHCVDYNKRALVLCPSLTCSVAHLNNRPVWVRFAGVQVEHSVLDTQGDILSKCTGCNLGSCLSASRAAGQSAREICTILQPRLVWRVSRFHRQRP